MRDVEDGDRELAVEAIEQAGERLLRLGVDSGRRLVQDEQRRLAGERLGDEGALLLAARERAQRDDRALSASPTRSIDSATMARSRRRSGPSSPPDASRPAATTSRTVAGASTPSCERWAR